MRRAVLEVQEDDEAGLDKWKEIRESLLRCFKSVDQRESLLRKNRWLWGFLLTDQWKERKRERHPRSLKVKTLL